jgi:uncharacterized protein YcbK (DUF882 family)
VRLVLAALLAIAVLLPPTTVGVTAEVGDRTLYLYHTHTHETARITFKRNGVYDPKGLQQLNWFLRDWRNNQTTTMAPQLFDLVWEVYQKVGAKQPINIVSAYRSPKTNAYLRARSSGVANNSQHMLGHAMDWFIPGVSLVRLRQVAMQQQVGGVGFYPTSGSPFVHTDVGTVRAWPRMTEAQLHNIFPDGRTLHLPTNGRVLSQAGRAYAQAQWNQCHAVPCTNAAALRGGAASMGATSMVSLATTSMTGKTFADIRRGVNPGNAKIRNPGDISTRPDPNAINLADDESDSDVTAGPAETAVATVAVDAPFPLAPPAALQPVLQTASIDNDATLARAAAVPFNSLFPAAYDTATPATAAIAARSEPPPVPVSKSRDLMVATGEIPIPAQPQDAVAAIAAIEAPVPLAPAPRTSLGAETALAYAPIGPGSAAEHTLESIIENETTGAIAMGHAGGTALTNSVGTPIGADALKSYAADKRTQQGIPATLAGTVQLASFKARDTALVAPDFSTDLVQPMAMSSDAFASFTEPAATDLDPATELGPMMVRLSFRAEPRTALSAGHFAPAHLLVASR